MRTWRKCIAVLGAAACLSLTPFCSARASEAYYLNNNSNYPMIANTGGIFNTGTQGLFLDLYSVKIEGVYSDGMAVSVPILDAEGNGVIFSRPAHFRFAVDGRSFVQRDDKSWMEVSSHADDPTAQAVYFIKQELGNSARREKYVSQMDQLKEAAGSSEKKSVIPEKAAANDGSDPFIRRRSPVKRRGAVKRKGQVQRKNNNEKVKVEITRDPEVEITSNPPPQVDIT